MATEELAIFVRLKDFASKEFGKLQGGITGFGKGALGAFKSVTGAVFSLKGALAGVGVVLSARALFNVTKDSVALAASLESLDLAFQSLTKNIGGSTEILAALRRGTRQTVSDLDLMKSANTAILLGVASSAEEFETLTTTARRLGRAVGIDTVTAFQKLTVAIGRQSDLRLDDLGIIISVAEANKKFAQSLGTTVDALTKAQKGQAFLNAAMEQSEVLLGNLGEDTLTLSDEFGRFKTELENVREDVLRALTPAFTEFFSGIADSVRESKPEILRFFADLVEGAGTAAKAFGSVLDLVIAIPRTLKEIELGFALRELDKLEARVRSIDSSIQGIPQGIASGLFAQRRIAQEAVDIAKASVEQIKGELQPLSALGSDAGAAIAEAAKKGAEQIRQMADEAERAQDAFQEFGPTLEQLGVFKIFGPTAEQLGLPVIKDLAEEYKRLDEASKEYVAGGLRDVIRGNDAFAESQIRAKKEAEEFAAALEKSNQKAAELAEKMRRLLDPIAGAQDAFKNLELDSEEWGKAASEAIFSVANALTDNLTDGIVSLIDGTKSFKEAFRDTARSILTDIARIIVQTLILKAVQATLGGAGGGIVGAIAGAEKGGVFPGKIERVRGLEVGDVIHPPGGIFAVGEGRRSEAVMPLARTKSGELGVQVAGGSAGGGVTQIINVEVNYNGTIGEQALFRKHAEDIAAITAEKMRTSAGYRESMRAA